MNVFNFKKWVIEKVDYVDKLNAQKNNNTGSKIYYLLKFTCIPDVNNAIYS